jgi:hypothetical protein
MSRGYLACSRVALVLMVLSASFCLAGCAAIDDLKFAIAQWFESATFPDGRGVLPDNDLPNATPMISLEKIPKQDATKPSEKMPKATRKLPRPQTVKLQKNPRLRFHRGGKAGRNRGAIRAACDVAIASLIPKRRRPEFFHAEIGPRSEYRPAVFGLG